MLGLRILYQVHLRAPSRNLGVVVVLEFIRVYYLSGTLNFSPTQGANPGAQHLHPTYLHRAAPIQCTHTALAHANFGASECNMTREACAKTPTLALDATPARCALTRASWRTRPAQKHAIDHETLYDGIRGLIPSCKAGGPP